MNPDHDNIIANIKHQLGSSDATKSAGYSTDVDTFSRSKRLLALERMWMRNIKKNLLSVDRLQAIVKSNIRVNFKNYESLSLIVEKILTFI